MKDKNIKFKIDVSKNAAFLISTDSTDENIKGPYIMMQIKRDDDTSAIESLFQINYEVCSEIDEGLTVYSYTSKGQNIWYHDILALKPDRISSPDLLVVAKTYIEKIHNLCKSQFQLLITKFGIAVLPKLNIADQPQLISKIIEYDLDHSIMDALKDELKHQLPLIFLDKNEQDLLIGGFARLYTSDKDKNMRDIPKDIQNTVKNFTFSY